MGKYNSNLQRMNTVLAIVLLGAAYASAEAGYLRGGYGGYGDGGYGGYRGYGGYGYYGKRSAEAEAEPGYLRGGYGGYGYGRGYGGYGYSRGYYGKREAEAVAEADAEPGYLSRGYGYGGYGYRGYSGYGYGRGYYGKREAEAEPGYLRGYGGYGYGVPNLQSLFLTPPTYPRMCFLLSTRPTNSSILGSVQLRPAPGLPILVQLLYTELIGIFSAFPTDFFVILLIFSKYSSSFCSLLT